MLRRLYSKVVLTCVISLFVFSSFQNCTQNVELGTDLKALQSSSLVSTVNGLPATNKKTIDLNINFISNSTSQMRISMKSDMTDLQGNEIPFESFKNTFTLDFSKWNEFADGGKKDGVKTIYVELKNNPSQPAVKTSLQIILDTVAPEGKPLDIMAKGVQGKIHNKNEKVTMTVDFWDNPSKITSTMSGIDQALGMKVGWVTTADCSENNVDAHIIKGWSAPQKSFDIAWPMSDPMDNFYICVLIKDLAGNKFSILSQPMSRLWSVFAGDNNQGNGGSVNATNVRFNFPQSIVEDSKGNVYVYDAYLYTIRKISSDKTITAFAGNGLAGGATTGDALQSRLAIVSMTIDSNDQIYFTSGKNSAIFKIDTREPNPQIVKVSGDLTGYNYLKIDQLNNNTLYINHVNNFTNVANDAYLFKIPLVNLTSSTTISTLIASNIFAGNGSGRKSLRLPGCPATLGGEEFLGEVTADVAIDFPNSTVEFGERNPDGSPKEIYYSTRVDYAGLCLGHSQVRVFYKNTSGIWMNKLLLDSPNAAATEISYTESRDATGALTDKFLILTDNLTGVKKMNLFNVTTPVAYSDLKQIQPVEASYGITKLKKFNGGGYIYSASADSRIALLLETDVKAMNTSSTPPNLTYFGRVVYSSSDHGNPATSAVINNPSGIAVDKIGNTYIYESLSHILRKIDNSGNIQAFAGEFNSQRSSTSSLSSVIQKFTPADMRFDGRCIISGGRGALKYDSNSNKLLISEVVGCNGNTFSVYDFSSNEFTIFPKDINLPDPNNSPSMLSSVQNWASSDFTLVSSTVGTDVMMARNSGVGGVTRTIMRKYASISGSYFDTVNNKYNFSDIAGTGLGIAGAPDLTLAPTLVQLPVMNSLVSDSVKNVYFYSDDILYRTDSTLTPSSRIDLVTKNLGAVTMRSVALVEESTSKHFFGLGASGNIYHTKIDSSGVTSDILCMPGTNLNYAQFITNSSDGNLVLTDTRNNRVLKYYIRDASGNLVLSVKNATTGTCDLVAGN